MFKCTSLLGDINWADWSCAGHHKFNTGFGTVVSLKWSRINAELTLLKRKSDLWECFDDVKQEQSSQSCMNLQNVSWQSIPQKCKKMDTGTYSISFLKKTKKTCSATCSVYTDFIPSTVSTEIALFHQ